MVQLRIPWLVQLPSEIVCFKSNNVALLHVDFSCAQMGVEHGHRSVQNETPLPRQKLICLFVSLKKIKFVCLFVRYLHLNKYSIWVCVQGPTVILLF